MIDLDKVIEFIKDKPEGYIFSVIHKNPQDTITMYYIITKRGETVKGFRLDDNFNEIYLQKYELNIEDITNYISGYQIKDVRELPKSAYIDFKEYMYKLLIASNEQTKKLYYNKIKEILR